VAMEPNSQDSVDCLWSVGLVLIVSRNEILSFFLSYISYASNLILDFVSW
jgi:hypothetical protein